MVFLMNIFYHIIWPTRSHILQFLLYNFTHAMFQNLRMRSNLQLSSTCIFGVHCFNYKPILIPKLRSIMGHLHPSYAQSMVTCMIILHKYKNPIICNIQVMNYITKDFDILKFLIHTFYRALPSIQHISLPSIQHVSSTWYIFNYSSCFFNNLTEITWDCK